MVKDEDFDFKEQRKQIDEALAKHYKKEDKKLPAYDQVRFAHEIKRNPPPPDYMRVEVPPGIYSIDLANDARWWFEEVCTVFPFILDQNKRTHMDLKDSFKEKKRLPDFNYMWVLGIFVGLIGLFGFTKLFGFW